MWDSGLVTQLKESYEKSLDLAFKMGTFRRENLRRYDSSRMMHRINNILNSIKKLKIESDEKVTKKPKLGYSKTPTLKSIKLLETYKHSPNAAHIHFRDSLQESHTRLKKSRAGYKANEVYKTIGKPETKILSEMQNYKITATTEAATRNTQESQVTRSISPMLQSELVERASSVTPTPKKVPHYDYITGKISKAIELPTFHEYCRNKKWQEVSFTNFTSLNKKVQSAGRKINNFKKEIQGLEIYLNMDTGVKWDGNKKFLRRLNYEPASKDTIVKVYIDRMKTTPSRQDSIVKGKRQAINAILNDQEKDEFRNLLIDEEWDSDDSEVDSELRASLKKKETENKSGLKRFKIKQKPVEKVFDNCIYNFMNARQKSEEKLNHIVERVNKDRNFNFLEKSRVLNEDCDKYVSSCHTSHKLQNLRRKIEIKRRAKRYFLEEQSLLYEELLKILRTRNRYPSDQELLLIDFVKRITEEETLLGTSNMVNFLKLVSEEDQRELHFKELVDLILDAINKKVNMV